MAGDGTSFSIDIVTNAPGLGSMADALAKASSNLNENASAAERSAAALAAARAAFNQTESGAEKAAKAVEKLEGQLTEQSAKAVKAAADSGITSAAYKNAVDKLQNLAAAHAKAVSKSDEMTAAMNKQASVVDKLSANTKDLAQAEKKAAEATGTGKANEAAEAFGKLGGPIGRLGQQFFGAKAGVEKLGAALGSGTGLAAVAAVGIAAIAVAIVAVTAAAIAGAAHITSWAIGLADAARTNSLLAAGVAKSVAGGEMLEAKLADLSGLIPLSRDEMMGLAKPLADAGLKGQELNDALQNAAITAAKAKFGPDFQKQMLSLPVQTARLKANFDKLFSGLKIENLLKAFQRLVDLFDESTGSGKAIKSVFESIMQPIIDGLTAALPKMIRFFLQMEVWALKALIFIKPYGQILQVIGLGFASIGVAIAALVGVLVVASVAFGAFLGAVIGGVIYIATKFSEMTGGVAATWESLTAGIKGAWQAIVDFFAGLSLSEMGSNLIQGLIDGILGAAGGVADAVKGAVGGAIDAATSLLQINSPSKVFAAIGASTGEGMAQGVDASADAVQGSMQTMVDPSSAAGAAAAPSSGSGGGSVYQITINANGSDGESIAAALRGVLADLGAQAGTAVPA